MYVYMCHIKIQPPKAINLDFVSVCILIHLYRTDIKLCKFVNSFQRYQIIIFNALSDTGYVIKKKYIYINLLSLQYNNSSEHYCSVKFKK